MVQLAGCGMEKRDHTVCMHRQIQGCTVENQIKAKCTSIPSLAYVEWKGKGQTDIYPNCLATKKSMLVMVL